MASLFTHAFVGAALGQAGSKDARKDWRFWCAAIACSMVPDVDSIGFHMGVPYGALWGHRGMTHSLLFAAVVAASIAVMFVILSLLRFIVIVVAFFVRRSFLSGLDVVILVLVFMF